MLVRLFIAFASLAVAAPALAQGSCVPKDTPDTGIKQNVPVLFGHCAGDGKCGAVDKTGAWRIPPKYSDVLIVEDFIVVPENDDWSKFAFLDQDGKNLGSGDYSISVEEQLPVSEGMLPVQVGEKTGFVDHTGKLVVPAEFGYAWAFDHGLSAAEKDGRHGYIDKTGAFVINAPPGYDDLGSFSGDVAVVGKEGSFGLIDKTGKIVLEPKFAALYADGDVLIALENDASGIVDRAGNWVSKPEFTSIGLFSKGLAPAQKDEKWGFIDTCGKWKIDPKYDNVVGFEAGPARVKSGEKWGLIDMSGKEIYPPSASYIGEGAWTDGLISFSPDDAKYGLMDVTGKVVIEPKYDSVEPLGGGVLLSYTGEEEKLLKLDGSEIKIAPAP
jgi:hypothetical protein